MQNCYKLGLVTLLFSWSFSFNLYASTSGSEERSEEQVEYCFPRRITTLEDLGAYGENLIGMANCPEREYVIELASRQPEIDLPLIKLENNENYENYIFGKTYALGVAYKALALKKDCPPKQSEEYCKLLLEAFTQYFNIFSNFTSALPHVNKLIAEHHYGLYRSQGDTYFTLSGLYKSEQKPQIKRPYWLPEAIVAYEKAVLYGGQCIENSRIDKDRVKLPHYLNVVEETKFSLYSAYLSGAQFQVAHERSEWLRQAKVLKQEFMARKEGKYYKAAQESWQVYEKAQQVLASRALPKGRAQQIARAKKLQLKLQTEDQRDNIIKNIHTHTVPLKTKITGMHDKLDTLLSHYFYTGDKGEKLQILANLNKIENKIYHSLFSNDTAYNVELSLEALKPVYETYNKFLEGEHLFTFLPKLILHFKKEGELSKVYEKVSLLEYLEQKCYGNTRVVTRYIIAAMDNLMGNHEKWLAFEKEVEKKAQKLKKKKQRAKLKKRQALVELINQDLEANTKLKEEKDDLKDKSIAELSAQKVAYQDPSLSMEVNMWQDNNSQESKAVKLERHEEAVKQRETKAKKDKEKITEEKNILSPSKVLPKETLDPVLPEVFSLTKLYNLTGLAEVIDNNIEQNHWKFTLEDLQHYYEAMGCHYKASKGSHKKLAMPKATLVTQGENLITIMNEFKGTFTLPQWKDKHVPYYLRTQILVARKKLAANRLKLLSEGVGTSGS
ncbi:MAG: hypothetical protein IBJ00_01215 [Alphaproteobacteria bacterium]|nr:hypothetical protein [Alphaproteobacteria bacterium]